MNEFIDIIKIAGPVGAVALIFLYFDDKKDTRHTQLVEKHMDRNSEALKQQTSVLTKLVGLINILGKTLKGKVIK